jgi:hypothetical protein
VGGALEAQDEALALHAGLDGRRQLLEELGHARVASIVPDQGTSSDCQYSTSPTRLAHAPRTTLVSESPTKKA